MKPSIELPHAAQATVDSDAIAGVSSPRTRREHVSYAKTQVEALMQLPVVGKLDEAHLLDYEQLETVLMLSNQAMDQDSPLAVLLVGQPTLRRQMKIVTLAALQQRIGIRYSMPPMSGEETASYVKHDLALAGRSDTLFSDDAIALIHTTARGYPRAVNNLALQALVATYAERKAIVDESAARAAIAETDDNQ